MALTDTAIRAAKSKELDYKLADGGGLYLLVTRAGGKLWRLKYRAHGVERKLALRKYPDVTLGAAGKARDEARAKAGAGDAPPRQLVAQERQRVRAKRQLQRSIVFYHLASIGERPQRDRGLDPLGARHVHGLIRRHEQRQRCLAKAAHLPQSLSPVGAERMIGVGIGELLDRGALHARPAPEILHRREHHRAPCPHDRGAVSVREPVHLPQARAHRRVAAASRLERAIPAAGIDAGRPYSTLCSRASRTICAGA